MKNEWIFPNKQNTYPLVPFCRRCNQCKQLQRSARFPLLTDESVRSTETLVQNLRRDFEYLPAAESGEAG